MQLLAGSRYLTEMEVANGNLPGALMIGRFCFGCSLAGVRVRLLFCYRKRLEQIRLGKGCKGKRKSISMCFRILLGPGSKYLVPCLHLTLFQFGCLLCLHLFGGSPCLDLWFNGSRFIKLPTQRQGIIEVDQWPAACLTAATENPSGP